MTTSIRSTAITLAHSTADAYSADRYGAMRWEACAFMLLSRGMTVAEAEAVLRSKWTRWAADQAKSGRPSAKALAEFIDDPRNNCNLAVLMQAD